MESCGGDFQVSVAEPLPGTSTGRGSGGMMPHQRGEAGGGPGPWPHQAAPVSGWARIQRLDMV